MNCPICLDKLRASTTLIEGYTVLWCPSCRRKAAVLEGVADEWIPDGGDQVTFLKISIRDGENWRALVNADEDDPRWQMTS